LTNFGELYRQYAPDVFRFALYLCGERAEAEDITAETFVRAWTAAERIRMSTVKGYLFTIARNLFLHGRRKASRETGLEDVHADRGQGPEAKADADSELRAVLAALGQLPELDRAALLMRAEDEIPYEDIARALGISLASVKVKIHRARLKLAHIRSGVIQP
jgi:RNA polymerase sigma-70 factor (ECF subfamily)